MERNISNMRPEIKKIYHLWVWKTWVQSCTPKSAMSVLTNTTVEHRKFVIRSALDIVTL